MTNTDPRGCPTRWQQGLETEVRGEAPHTHTQAVRKNEAQRRGP